MGGTIISKHTGLVEGIAKMLGVVWIVPYGATSKKAIITGNGVNYRVKVGPGDCAAGSNS